MQDVLASQQAVFYSIARALDNFKKIGRAKLTAATIRSRLATLQDTWSQCVNNHATMLQLVPEKQQKELLYFQGEQFAAHEDLYQTARDYMNECLEQLEPVLSRNASFNASVMQAEPSSFSLTHFPPIKLPPFSGKADEWENFRDRFQSLITDNKDLSDFSRMHFLAASLTGSARDALSGFKITADNFTAAWKALTERFENKRHLIENHVSNLYNLPKMTRESAFELHALRDRAEQAVGSLRRLERSSDDIVSDILVYFISQKLDPTTRRAWKLKSGDSDKAPIFDDLKRFISSRAVALEDLHRHDSDKLRPNTKVTSAATASSSFNLSCPLCRQNHLLSKCQQFVTKSSSQRCEVVKQFKRCFNCLSDRHAVSECTSKYTCRKCQQRHHTMMHIDSNSLLQTDATVASVSRDSVVTSATVTALSSVTPSATPTPVVLATAKVAVRSPSGRELIVRALLDGGSELTFITEKVAQLLRLSRLRTYTATSGINCVDAGMCRSATLIHIAPRDSPEPIFKTIAYIMKSLTKYVPRNASSQVKWKHLSDLNLADDDPTGATPIDLIIDSDLYNRVLVNARHGPIGQLGAIQSHFGWVLSGTTSIPNHIVHNAHVVSNAHDISDQNGVNTTIQTDQRAHIHHVVTHCCSLEQELHKFWEVEEIPRVQCLSAEEEQCERHFIDTHSRAPNGRYIVRLPFRNGPPIDIGESREVAERRLASLRRKLTKQPDLNKEYSEFLQEYEQLGHMQLIYPNDNPNSQVVYIPHHPVI